LQNERRVPAGDALNLCKIECDHRVPVPPEAQAALSQPHLKVHVGDVWWIPEGLHRYPGGKGRFCLVVALETPPGSSVPARAHYVAGSTGRGSQPEIVVEPRHAGLEKRTHFSFWWSGDLDLATLIARGRFKGKLESARLAEIRVAICASKRVALKKLVVC
jgi:hypothetical protein